MILTLKKIRSNHFHQMSSLYENSECFVDFSRCWRASMWLYSCESCAQHIQSLGKVTWEFVLFSTRKKWSWYSKNNVYVESELGEWSFHSICYSNKLHWKQPIFMQHIHHITIFHHDLNIEEDSFKQFPSNAFQKCFVDFPRCWRASMWLYSCESCARHIQSLGKVT